MVFREMMLQEYFPGLKENINHQSVTICLEESATTLTWNDSTDTPPPIFTVRIAMKHWLDPIDKVCTLRTNNSLKHAHCSISLPPKEGQIMELKIEVLYAVKFVTRSVRLCHW
jgi:hypothetical protein